MPKVHVTSDIEIDFDEVLHGLARLEPSDLAQLVERVIALQARRRAPSLPKNEADLLQKINQGPPPEVRRRSAELTAKLRDETITPAEHQELMQLIDQLELADAERLQDMIALAQLRQISVDALMQQLGIRPPAYA
ncbi:MAG: hypothetical protein HYZ81_11180 [Nitrospinae bacterium]|nr:hypothetical protein [Nitrospinota bacterium]